MTGRATIRILNHDNRTQRRHRIKDALFSFRPAIDHPSCEATIATRDDEGALKAWLVVESATIEILASESPEAPIEVTGFARIGSLGSYRRIRITFTVKRGTR